MEDHNHRWSDVIPPQTALSFAALWDPDEGMVTFSGGHLLDSEMYTPSSRRDVPRDAYDGQSVVLTLDGFTLPVFGTGMGPRVPTVTFAFNATDDTHSTLDPFLRSAAERRLQAQTQVPKRQPSVHIDWSQVRSVGRSIYTLARAPLERRIFHSNKTNSSSESNASGTTDGFFEEAPMTAGTGTFTSAPVLVNLNLRSAFSMTTTSTTGYIDIDTPSVYSYATTAREGPPSEAWSTLQDLDFASAPNRPVERGNRLHKPRRGLHVHIPADPAEVLARPTYNHVSPPRSATERTETPVGTRQCLRRFKSLPKLPRMSSTIRSPKSSTSPSEMTHTSSSTSSPQSLPPLPPLVRGHSAIDSPVVNTPPGSSNPSPIPLIGRPPLRRQKSVAKVVMDSVGRFASRRRATTASTPPSSFDFELNPISST
ncbi:hypothetical protein BDW22DRAFT_289233 [Trametopsis cervina]|nr:hypothetical protein BDW22DRAFT_289233 [Trametopsis cervina]